MRLGLSPSSRIGDWMAATERVRSIYKKHHGFRPNLLRPRRFTEKMQWRKLFDMNPLFVTLCDKLAVRDYIASRIGSDLLIPLLWSGDDPEQVPLGELVPPYVIKSTHASGHTIFVGADEVVDQARVRATLRNWLAHCHGTAMDEPGYVNVPRRLMVERQVFGSHGERPLERRMFVFGSRVRFINTVLIIDGAVRNGAFHTPDWRRLNWEISSPLLQRPFPEPEHLAALISAAERQGEGLDHIRVDFFDCGSRIFVGEMTPYSWSGLSHFRTDEADHVLGSIWPLRAPGPRALATMLRRRRNIGR